MEETSSINNQPGNISAPSTSEKLQLPVYASIADRLIAQMVDGGVAFGLFFFTGMTLAPRLGGATASGFDLAGRPALIVITLTILLNLVYFILAEATVGATLGKLVAGIRARTKEGQRVSLRASVIRNLMRFIDGIGVYLVGAISVMATKRNQRLGDLAAGTIVVRHESSRAVRVASLIAAILLVIGGVGGGFVMRKAQEVKLGAVPLTLLTSAVMTKRISTTHEALEPATVFRSDEREIYCAFTLGNTPAGTTIKAILFAVDIGEYAKPDSTLFTISVISERGPMPSHFTFTNTSNWPPGKYRVELYLDDRLTKTLNFTIEA